MSKVKITYIMNIIAGLLFNIFIEEQGSEEILKESFPEYNISRSEMNCTLNDGIQNFIS